MAESRKAFAAALKAPARPNPAPAPPARAPSPLPAAAPSADAAGNQQMMRALGVRPALAVSAPTDPDEVEADLAANAFVARAPLPIGFGARGAVADIRRKCASCEEERISRKADATGAAAAGATIHALHASRGEPLAPRVRQPYERFFGADLSAMRIHTGESADGAARSLAASAFAHGNDVYFRSGGFDPSSADGERLLAHETAHVVQHARGGGDTVRRQPAEEDEGILGGLVSFGTGLATAALERLAPGALAFFRGIRGSVVEQVRSGFEGMFDGLARRVHAEGFTGALASIIAELAGGAARGIGEFVAGRCAALGAGAEMLLQLGLKFGRAQIESLRQAAADIGAYFGELWDAYGAPAAEALGSFASDIWEGITAQVAEWWEALAPVREAVGELWDSIVEVVTQGLADLEELKSELFRLAVKEWEKVRERILPFMGYVKAVGVILLLLSPLGPFIVVGAAAYGLYQLVTYVWETWGRPLTAQVRTYLAEQVLPAIMEQLEALQAGIEQAKAWFGSLAGQLAAQAAALLQASGALPYLRVARDFIAELAAGLQEAAASLRALVDEFAAAAAELLRAAVDFFRPIAEFLRQSVLVLVFGPLAILDDGVWESVKTLARLAPTVPCLRELAEFVRLPAILEQGERFRTVMKAVWEVISNPETVLNALRDALAPMAAAVPGLAASTMAGLLFPTDRAHREGVEYYLQAAIAEFMANWWEELKRLGWTLIWPFDELRTQLPLVIERGSNAIDAFFKLEIGRAIDEFLGMMQAVNAILGALWGWFAIAAVLIGGVIGAIGTVPSVGTSIGAGAAAGWALAAQVGLVLLGAMLATEGAIIAHSMFDLRYTNRVIGDAKAQGAADDSDYQAIAHSVFSIAVLTALVILGALAQKLASAIWRAAGRVVRGPAALEEPVPARPRAPVEEPARPVEEPARPVERPARPAEEPVPVAEERARPVEEPAPVPEEPARPVEEPAPVAEEPARPAEEPAPIEERAPVEPPPEGPATLGEVTSDLRSRAARLREGLPERRAAVARRRAQIESELERARSRARSTAEIEQARQRAARQRRALAEEEARIREAELEARRLENQALTLEEQAARWRRLPEDLTVDGRKPPDASTSPAPSMGSPTQIADVGRWVARLRELGATDIRVNQAQVNARGRMAGINRPDLQYTLNGQRYYVEWDTPTSGRGPGHAHRIRLNDPSATSVGEITVEPGYPLPEPTANRVTLITME